jgi:hypothetical protein
MQRPDPSEYDSYYSLYVNQVADGDILEALANGVQETDALLRDVSPDWARYRYAEGKWTTSEVIGHIVDTERVFAYRALCVARGDTGDLPSMDQDQYAAGSNASDRTLVSLLDELQAVRGASVTLFANLDPSTHTRAGRASGCPFTVRTFAWIIAGHEIHHRKAIAERYLAALRDGATV